jgi:hypothetical protein
MSERETVETVQALVKAQSAQGAESLALQTIVGSILGAAVTDTIINDAKLRLSLFQARPEMARDTRYIEDAIIIVEQIGRGRSLAGSGGAPQ